MNIYVFGLGAIGSNLLLQIAKANPDHQFHGIDFDVVEDRNLRTQAYFREHKKAPKALAMQQILGRFIQKPNYKPHKFKVEKDFAVEQDGLILDCFDNAKSRKLIKKIADANKIPALHIGFSVYELGNAEIIWNEEYSVKDEAKGVEELDVCTLNQAGPFIHFVVNLAAMEVLNFLETDKKQSYIVTGMSRVRKL